MRPLKPSSSSWVEPGFFVFFLPQAVGADSASRNTKQNYTLRQKELKTHISDARLFDLFKSPPGEGSPHTFGFDSIRLNSIRFDQIEFVPMDWNPMDLDSIDSDPMDSEALDSDPGPIKSDTLNRIL